MGGTPSTSQHSAIPGGYPEVADVTSTPIDIHPSVCLDVETQRHINLSLMEVALMTAPTFTIDHAYHLDDEYHQLNGFAYPKMVPEVKERWIAQLRSDQYTQVHGNLKKMLDFSGEYFSEPTPDAACGFCCLGVLCEIAVTDTIIEAGQQSSGVTWDWEEAQDENNIRYYDYWLYGGNEDMPPNDVYAWAGVHPEIGGYLASQNDQGSSFAEIADWIEKYL